MPNLSLRRSGIVVPMTVLSHLYDSLFSFLRLFCFLVPVDFVIAELFGFDSVIFLSPLMTVLVSCFYAIAEIDEEAIR